MSKTVTPTRKEWLTAREIAELELPGVPGTFKGILLWADRECWNDHPAWCRDRKGRGGGREYHINLLIAAFAVKLATTKRALKQLNAMLGDP